MLRKKNIKWPDTTSAEGTLFFAQAMLDFLREDAFEGFRAYSLDTVARLYEALALGNDIKQGKVPRPTFKSIEDELIWSLKGDDVLQAIAPMEADLLQDKIKKTSDIEELCFLIEMIVSKYSKKYQDVLADKVSELIPNSSDRISLLRNTGFLVSHLLNDGHSRDFLLRKLRERFFESDIKRPGARMVRGFIKSIRAERRKYKVVCVLESRVANLLDHIGGFEPLNLKDLPLHAQESVVDRKDFNEADRYICEVFSAPDAYQAAAQMANRLADARALMVLPAQRLNVSAKPGLYVFTPRAKFGQIISPERGSLEAAVLAPIAGRRLKSLTKVPRQLDECFDLPSRERIFGALSTASVAFETPLVETRLISFWSAFEVLMSDPRTEDVRINHYVRHLVPCITLRYQRRLFSAVYDSLLINYHSRIGNLIRNIPVTSAADQHTRFTKLIILPEYDQLRQQLMGMMKFNPLLRHRLFRLQKYYGTPFACRETIIDHSKRVEWQLHRIYRTRNNLVHSGRTPIYIDSLVRNCLDYFRSTIIALARKASERDGQWNLDQVIAELGFEYDCQLRQLDKYKKENFDECLIESVFGYG